MAKKQELQKTGHIKWLNCAKTVAILAVLTDHSWNTLYSDQRIQEAAFFSVSLFILLSGMTSYMSDERHDESWLQNFIRSSKKLVIAYLIAVVIYELCLTRTFSIVKYFDYVIHFNASPPHYFVLLYLQLMVVNRPLYLLLKKFESMKYSAAYELLTLLVVTVFSIWTTKHTQFLGVYGGGGKLLGGTYLILYYLGMLCAKHGWLSGLNIKKSAILTIIGGAAYIAWLGIVLRFGREAIDRHFPFGDGLNPPGVVIGVMAVAMLVFCAGLFSLMDNFDALRPIVDVFDRVGNHTLYIFIYHQLFLLVCINYAGLILPMRNKWMKRLVYFAAMLIGPIVMELVINRLLALPKRLVDHKTKEAN